MTPVVAFEDLDSTNAEARRRAEAGERGPVWLLARRQSAGRGRRGRSWEAGQGNLTATLLLTLDKPPIEAAQLAFVAALAVGRMADAYVPASLVGFKWPNDILIEGRKAAGMLIETGAAPGGGLWLAVGVGVNLVDFPTDVERPATALANHLSHGVRQAPSQDEAVGRLAAAFDEALALWLAQGFEPIRGAWLARAIGIGGPCSARLAHQTVEGTAEGLDGDGALLLRLASGELRRIAAGDVFRNILMLLAIEQGNTNTLFAVHDGSDWLAQWRTATQSARTADEYAVWLSQLLILQGLKFADIDGCIVSTVVPQSLFNLRNLARRYLKVEPLVVGENAELKIDIRIDKPSEAGADRLVNTIGAFVTYGGPLIVVDSGTATTFDVVAADGAFEGGVIAPGINMSMEALHQAAARLPRVAIQRPPKVIGADTVGNMQSGIYWGYVSLIEGLIDRIKAEYGRPMRVIGTGGVASLFQGATDRIDNFDPDITVRGLLEIWRRNHQIPA